MISTVNKFLLFINFILIGIISLLALLFITDLDGRAELQRELAEAKQAKDTATNYWHYYLKEFEKCATRVECTSLSYLDMTANNIIWSKNQAKSKGVK